MLREEHTDELFYPNGTMVSSTNTVSIKAGTHCAYATHMMLGEPMNKEDLAIVTMLFSQDLKKCI